MANQGRESLRYCNDCIDCSAELPHSYETIKYKGHDPRCQPTRPRRLVFLTLWSVLVLIVSVCVLVICICTRVSARHESRAFADFKPGGHIACIECEELSDGVTGPNVRAAMLSLETTLVNGTHMCCANNVKDMSTLLTLILRRRSKELSELPVPNGADFLMSEVSAHLQYDANTEDAIEFQSPELNSRHHARMYFTLDTRHALGTHIREVDVRHDHIRITHGGTYYVYTNVYFRLVNAYRCNHFKQKIWKQKVIRRHNNSTRDVLLTGTHTCCESCVNTRDTNYAGGLFDLREGDHLHVEISDKRLVGYYDSASYMGLVLVSPGNLTRQQIESR